MIRINLELLDYMDRLILTGNDAIIEESFISKEIIIDQDKRYSHVFFIKKGIVKVYLSDEKGKDFIQEFLGEGMEFGEIEVFTEKPSFCCIESITTLKVYKISFTDFNELLEKDKKFNRLIMKAFADKLK